MTTPRNRRYIVWDTEKASLNKLQNKQTPRCVSETVTKEAQLVYYDWFYLEMLMPLSLSCIRPAEIMFHSAVWTNVTTPRAAIHIGYPWVGGQVEPGRWMGGFYRIHLFIDQPLFPPINARKDEKFIFKIALCKDCGSRRLHRDVG
jgi:hypothetical protein